MGRPEAGRLIRASMTDGSTMYLNTYGVVERWLWMPIYHIEYRNAVSDMGRLVVPYGEIASWEYEDRRSERYRAFLTAWFQRHPLSSTGDRAFDDWQARNIVWLKTMAPDYDWSSSHVENVQLLLQRAWHDAARQ